MKSDIEVDGEKLVVVNSNDVEPLLDHLAELRATSDGKSSSGELVHVGELDPVIAQEYVKTSGITWTEFWDNPVHITRIMNDPDYKRFRVWQGCL